MIPLVSHGAVSDCTRVSTVFLGSVADLVKERRSEISRNVSTTRDPLLYMLQTVAGKKDMMQRMIIEDHLQGAESL